MPRMSHKDSDKKHEHETLIVQERFTYVERDSVTRKHVAHILSLSDATHQVFRSRTLRLLSQQPRYELLSLHRTEQYESYVRQHSLSLLSGKCNADGELILPLSPKAHNLIWFTIPFFFPQFQCCVSCFGQQHVQRFLSPSNTSYREIFNDLRCVCFTNHS